MSCSNANNVAIAPVNVLWQIEAEAQFDFAGLSDLDGVYFTLNSPDTEYYVWFNLDAGSVDPAPVGKTAIAVAVTTGDSAATIASAAQAAIDAEGDFGASVDGTVVTVKNASVGAVVDPADVDSGVVVSVCRRGKNYNLGLLDGDVELTFSPSNFIVQAHQTGVTPRAALYQGIETLEATTSLLETQQSNLKELYNIYGGAFTPPAGTEVFGVGTNKQGQNLLVDAARLVLRPVNAANNLQDTNVMLTIPVPDTLLFSGENPRTLSVTWQGFIDESKDSRVSALLFGDASQADI